MPYIQPIRRKPIDKAFEKLEWVDFTQGDLAYLTYKAMLLYVEKRTQRNYQSLSSAMAAVRDAEEEFRRMEMTPYEKEKRRRNGPVKVEAS